MDKIGNALKLRIIGIYNKYNKWIIRIIEHINNILTHEL